MRIYTIFGFFISAILFPLMSMAIQIGQVSFNNEASDTTRITDILIKVENEKYSTPGKLIVAIASELLDTPYTPGTLEGDEELLRVNMDGMDCTTFVENVLAMAMTIEGHRSSWRDFIYNLEQIRYRGGEMNGYASRLHYISDWIVDNSHRGIIKDVTALIGRADYQVKTLDFITSHRDKYPRLKDDEVFQKMKNAEIGYRSHRYPYIKPNNLKSADLKEGDIVAFTTATNGLDVSHVGIVTIVDGEPRLIHASSKGGKVQLDKLNLSDYTRRIRATGIRVVRLQD